MVNITKTFKTKIQNSPNNGDCKVKKKNDQEILKINCVKNKSVLFIFCCVFGCSHIRYYRETPININKRVQAIGNARLGGVIGGLFKKSYQEPRLVCVNCEPIVPALNETIIDIISLNIFFICSPK